jgi:hypothetical protein
LGEAREIFLEACCSIAAAFEPEGYHWSKSKCELVKKDECFTFRLHFQSSFRNVLLRGNSGPGSPLLGRVTSAADPLFVPLPIQLAEIGLYGSVKMIPHFGVADARIAKWRRTLQHPIRTDSQVAGGNLGHVSKKRAWLEVDLANSHARALRVAALISLIRNAALPLFALYHRDSEILETLVESGFEGSMEFAEVEHAVFLGGIDAGRKVIERYLRKWPTARAEYQHALDEFRQSGIPEVWDSKGGPRLAKAALRLEIEQ